MTMLGAVPTGRYQKRAATTSPMPTPAQKALTSASPNLKLYPERSFRGTALPSGTAGVAAGDATPAALAGSRPSDRAMRVLSTPNREKEKTTSEGIRRGSNVADRQGGEMRLFAKDWAFPLGGEGPRAIESGTERRRRTWRATSCNSEPSHWASHASLSHLP